MKSDYSYEYYIRFEYPNNDTLRNPYGIYRLPEGNVFRAEALRRDRKWHFSNGLVWTFLSGDTMTEIGRSKAQGDGSLVLKSKAQGDGSLVLK